MLVQLKGLRRVRKARGFTQTELGQAAGLSQVTISYLESGKKQARMTNAKQLAKVLLVPVKELVEEKGYVTPEAVAEYKRSEELELV